MGTSDSADYFFYPAGFKWTFLMKQPFFTISVNRRGWNAVNFHCPNLKQKRFFWEPPCWIFRAGVPQDVGAVPLLWKSRLHAFITSCQLHCNVPHSSKVRAAQINKNLHLNDLKYVFYLFVGKNFVCMEEAGLINCTSPFVASTSCFWFCL